MISLEYRFDFDGRINIDEITINICLPVFQNKYFTVIFLPGTWGERMKVFEQAIIGGISLANRFVRSATWEGLATSKGFCLPELTQLMVSLAEVV